MDDIIKKYESDEPYNIMYAVSLKDVNSIIDLICLKYHHSYTKNLKTMIDIEVHGDDVNKLYNIFHICIHKRDMNMFNFICKVILNKSYNTDFDIYNFKVKHYDRTRLTFPVDLITKAIRLGTLDIVKFIINSNRANCTYDRYMILACQYGHIPIIKYLSKYVELNELHFLITLESKRFRSIRYMIARCNIREISRYIVMNAINKKYPYKIIKLLFNKMITSDDLDIHYKNELLYTAISNYNIKVINMIIKYEIIVNKNYEYITDSLNYRPLIFNLMDQSHPKFISMIRHLTLHNVRFNDYIIKYITDNIWHKFTKFYYKSMY